MAGGDISLVCIIEDVIFILSLSLRKCLQVAMIRPRGVRPAPQGVLAKDIFSV